MLQTDLHKLYKWADTNNLKLNANMFELLWFGKEHEIIYATTYESYDDSNIDGKEQVRDLWIMMNNIATFTLHIRNIVKKAGYKMHWEKNEVHIDSGSWVLLPIGVNVTQLFWTCVGNLDSVVNVMNVCINRCNINNEWTASFLNYKVLYGIA